jgi:hypothetical protein
MEYRGKPYTIIQGIGPTWKWKVQLDDTTTKSGSSSVSRADAVAAVEWTVNKALAPKKVRLKPAGR